MAGKKAKPRKTTKKINFESLKPSDVLCPICRTILIEPVTLSCNHAFCKLCFEGTMENANLVCPLCRVRVGSWFRKARKEGQLVDENLWEAIQAQYPTEVQNKYQGIDNIIETDEPIIIVATPGEIRKEYELQRQRELEEQRKIREAEEKASAPLIKKLQEEEDVRNKLEEEKLRLDEELAKKLSQDLEKPSTSKCTPKKLVQIDKGKKQGPMDKFIKTDETKSNRLSFTKNEDRKKVYKTDRKRISITPNPTTDFATKEYTCHVLNAESRPINIENPFSIFNKSNYSKTSSKTYTSTVPSVQRKIKQPRKIIVTEERKSNGGYKSSSGSDDAIDQECRFYFKPIDTQKRHHLPGTVPLKIPSRRGKQAANVSIEPPSGKIINLQLKTVISAFARFSRNLRPSQQENMSSSCEIIEEEATTEVFPLNRRKRKIFDEDIPVEKKGRKEIYAKKNFHNIESTSNNSSPFYGFDNGPLQVVVSPPFRGFDISSIRESNREKDSMRKLLAKQEVDNESIVSTKELYKHFKTYSRHQNHPSKISLYKNKDSELSEAPLKLRISKPTSNGINMLEVIKNKLAELQNTIEESTDISKKESVPKVNIDVNRNIPKMDLQQNKRCSSFNPIRSSLDSNSTDANMTFKTRNVVDSFKNSNIQNNSVNNSKSDFKSVDFRFNNVNMSEIRYSNSDNMKFGNSLNDFSKSLKSASPNKVEDDPKPNSYMLNNNVNSTISFSKLLDNRNKKNSDTLNTSVGSMSGVNKNDLKPSDASTLCAGTKLNGSWKLKQGNSSPRKAQNCLASKNRKFESLGTAQIVWENTSPMLQFAHASTDVDADTKPKNLTLEDSPVNKTYQNKIKINSVPDSNHKITDTYSKVKSSPSKSSTDVDSDTKPKNSTLEDSPVNKTYQNKIKNNSVPDSNHKITDTYSKVKSSPSKSKKNKLGSPRAKVNNIELCLEPAEIDVHEKHVQEEADFELAKQLQAKFDSIQMPSRTRRGTRRQITLDEMLSV